MSHRLNLILSAFGAAMALITTSCASHAGHVPPVSPAATTTPASSGDTRTTRANALSSGAITADLGVTCQFVIVANVCFGPPGSTASMDFTVPLEVPYPPVRCDSIVWHERIIDQHVPAVDARAPMATRSTRALGDLHQCGESSYTLTVTAPNKPGGYIYKGAWASFTACFDLPRNPCSSLFSTAEGRLAIIAVATPVPKPTATPQPPTPAPTTPSGGGGSCGAAVARAPRAAGHNALTGVIGGGGGSPPPTDTPSPAPTCTPPVATNEPDVNVVRSGPEFPGGDAPQYAFVDETTGVTTTTAAAHRSPQSTGTVYKCNGFNRISYAQRGVLTSEWHVPCTQGAIVARVETKFTMRDPRAQNADKAPDFEQSQLCGNNPCDTPQVAFTVPGTSVIRVESRYLMTSPAGTSWSAWSLTNVPYNEARNAYPQIAPDGVTAEPPQVPFPLNGFRRCSRAERNTEVNGCTKRRQVAFFNATRGYYASRGWNVPSRGADPGEGYEVHHVLPLSWKGSNAGENGRFLRQSQHDPFTTWWNMFRLDGAFSPGE